MPVIFIPLRLYTFCLMTVNVLSYVREHFVWYLLTFWPYNYELFVQYLFVLWLRLWPFCLIFQKCLSFVCKLLVLCLRTACLVYVNCLSYFSEHSVYLLNLLILYICERVCLMSVNVLSCVCWSLYWTRSKHIKDSKERYLLGQKTQQPKG